MTERQRLVAAMIGISTLIFMDRTAVSIAAPDIIRDLHLSETAMGSVFSAFYAAYTAAMFASGALCDRFGARQVLAAGAMGVALFAGLTAVCGWTWLLPPGIALYCVIAARAGSGGLRGAFVPGLREVDWGLVSRCDDCAGTGVDLRCYAARRGHLAVDWSAVHRALRLDQCILHACRMSGLRLPCLAPVRSRCAGVAAGHEGNSGGTGSNKRDRPYVDGFL